MQWGQAIRRFNDGMRASAAALAQGFARVTPTPLRQVLPRNLFARIAIILASVLVLYYALGVLLMHKIDDNPNFTVDSENVLEGEPASMALASAILNREINHYGWVANDPF